MKVIFLDVDGVLNCIATFKSGAYDGKVKIEAEKVALVAKLAKETDAYVVISSTWRHGRGYRDLRGWLYERGLPKSRLIGRTPDLDRISRGEWDDCRGREILAWIETWNSAHPARAVTAYVVLDDDPVGQVDDHLVQTTFSDGLTAAHCARAHALLVRR